MTLASSLPRKNTVLIADDFAAFRSLIRLKLQENGFQTIVGAVDGLDAVTKAEELQPDLILLDIGMPKPNGNTGILPNPLGCSPIENPVRFPAC
jgi:CheY-like chemotaxis protein